MAIPYGPKFTRWRVQNVPQKFERNSLLLDAVTISSVNLGLPTFNFSTPSISDIKAQASLSLPTFNFSTLSPSILSQVNLGLPTSNFSSLALSSISQVNLSSPSFIFSSLPLSIATGVSVVDLSLPSFTFSSLALSSRDIINLGLPSINSTSLSLTTIVRVPVALGLPTFNFYAQAFPPRTLLSLGLPIIYFNVNEFHRKPINSLFTIVNTNEDWSQHFKLNSWSTIQDAIVAGYTHYAHPAMPSGSFEDIFDYGGVFNNVILNVGYTESIVAGAVTDTIKIATSVDGVTYTSFTTATSLYVQAVRFVKVRLEFLTPDRKGLALYSNIKADISVKLDTDSGSIMALAADAPAGGTLVLFNKAFKDINSITTTALSTKEPFQAFFNFLDAPNPTYFRVLVVDSSGNFVNAQVDWKARGLV